MNARLLRRLFLSVGMAAIVSASLYALTGTSNAASGPKSPRASAAGISSAASSPQSPGAGAARTAAVRFGIVNKAGKTIRSGTGVARIVRLGSGAADHAGAAVPDSVEGPSEYCYATFHESASVVHGDYFYVEIAFSSGPFVTGYGFNETTRVFYAETTEYQSGKDVWVSVLNNSSGTETLAGYYAVLYSGAGC
jgi:hypothetical protein